MDREFDIIVFGATGYVGKLTAEYLSGHNEGRRIALAGRDVDKLAHIRAELALDWDLVRADALDAASLNDMVRRTKVVISTVGPYTRYGEALVGMCAQHGTHYVDLCGEALFIRRMIDAHHERARESGARIVHACGFDSVPSDIGMLALYEKAGSGFSEVRMIVEELKGGLSGGTIDSMREVSSDARSDRLKGRLLFNPYTLCPDPKKEPRIKGLQDDREVLELPGIGWVGPFFMAMFNTRVVRRSNSLLDRVWGDTLYYKEHWRTGTGVSGRFKARALAAGTVALFGVIQVKRLRPLLSRWIPEPGAGPSRGSLDNGHFTVTHHGLTTDGRVVSSTMSGDGDPGYRVTSAMLANAALSLVEDSKELPGEGGVLTPATGLGLPYLRRLTSARVIRLH